MISAREIHQDGLTPSAQTWQNLHLAYTHGYGAVGAEVNTAGAQGQPVFSLGNLPPQGDPQMTEQRIYYGESNDVPYVVTGTTTNELDYQGSPESQHRTKARAASRSATSSRGRCSRGTSRTTTCWSPARSTAAAGS